MGIYPGMFSSAGFRRLALGGTYLACFQTPLKWLSTFECTSLDLTKFSRYQLRIEDMLASSWLSELSRSQAVSSCGTICAGASEARREKARGALA